MRGLKITLGVLLLVAALGPRAALAAELSAYEPVDEAKRLHFTLTFSEAVEAQVVNNYAGNFVDIGVEGLVIPQELAKTDHPPADDAALLFHRFTRFSEVDGEGHVRIYLGKYADPADVQVVQYGDRIEVDLVKPFYKVPEDIAVEAGVDEEPEIAAEEEPGFIPDEESPEETPAEDAEEPAETAELAAIEQPDEMIAFPSGLRTAGDDQPSDEAATETPQPEEQPAEVVVEEPEAVPEEAPDTEVAEEQPAEAAAQPAVSSGVFYDETSLADLGGDDTVPALPAVADEEEAPARPVRELHATPSYKQFDLDDVPVSEVQLRNMPFNEALLELVAGSGFNVIVGAGVENELMTLDFRQKEISLKRALDLLCMAYDLAYVVEDDAIVIRAAK